MKLVLAFVFVGICSLALSTPVVEETHEHQTNSKAADKDFLEKQKKVLSLFYHINQPSYIPEHVEIFKSFKIEDNKDHFTNVEVVDKIIEYYTNGYKLPKGEIFGAGYEAHLDQAIALFELFYYAKDFETFYKTAVVARHWVNEGLFLYSVSVAIIHRADTYGIVLPPIYEVYPWYFFSTETIQDAYRHKQTWDGQKIQSATDKYPGYTIAANYSGHYLNLHPEQSLSYYLEDVGINSFYYTYQLYYPFWMDGAKYGLKHDQRGELFYIIYQQLLVRYYLERLSNGFGQISDLDLENPVETPFYPSLQYPNGLPFPERPKFADVTNYYYTYKQSIHSRFGYSYTFYRDYVRRISDAIDRGSVINKQGEKVELYNDQHGFETVSNLLQGNPDSPDSHYYGPWLSYARHLLGYSYTPLNKYKVAPSALEHLETSLRDPAFYQIYKKLLFFYHKYQSRLHPYTRKELTFPGVSIEKVEVDRLITYFDEFYSDLSQGVYYSEKELKEHNNEFFVRAKQYRLNHKPFTYKIDVKSDKDVKAVVKIFIGPKYDQYGRYINISENRDNFLVLDKFIYELKTGENLIKRSSYETLFYGQDKTSYYNLYKQTLGAIQEETQFNIDSRENYFAFPHRYMLPKGTHGGFPYQFYFIVYPYKPYTGNKPQDWTHGYPRPGVGGPFMDDVPIYYPFDRPIKYGKMFYQDIPNTFFYETKIFHRRDINAVTPEN